jgi:RNA polymerase sigma factor for flagellar operon FliA
MSMQVPSSNRGGASVDDLVRQGLPLVQYVVSDIVARVPRSVPREDLVSAGNFGLAQAAKSYDPSRGVTFECFARTRIRGAILDDLRSRDWASRTVRGDARKVRASEAALEQELKRTPEAAEIAARLGVESRDVKRIQGDVHRASLLSFEGLFVDTGDAVDFIGDSDPLNELVNDELKQCLSSAITALPERLRAVVIGYFFEERQMSEIAAELGVTESRVSQMRAEALLMLKDGINTQLEPETMPDLSTMHGRVARRKAAYYAAIANASDLRSRRSATAATAAPARVHVAS